MSDLTNAGGTAATTADAYVSALMELLGDRDPLDVLASQIGDLSELLESIPDEVVTEPEAPGKWSIAQTVQHLADAELANGFRLRMIVAHDEPELGGFDQDLWAARLGYDRVNVGEALDQLRALRLANLRLILELDDEQLKRVGIHAERGRESVGHLIRLMAAHDLAHLRQIIRIVDSVTR